MKLRLPKTIPLFLVLVSVLAGCGQGGASAPTPKPWPTHAPGATPYVRIMSEGFEQRENENGGEDSGLSWDDIHEHFGNFYARDIELAMFRDLPQNEPCSFVPHSARFVLDEGEAMRMAELFDAEEDCEARVIAMHQITDGLDDWGFLTVVTCTPARLFELSEEITEEFMIEQFYPGVQERFDIAYWPDGLSGEAADLLEGYEARGCFYFEPETLARLEAMEPDEIADFALQAFTPSGWSQDANDMIPLLRGREGVEIGILYHENRVPAESLCLASMTPGKLTELSGKMPGRYLVRIADETLRSAYDGAVRLRIGPDGEEMAEDMEP